PVANSILYVRPFYARGQGSGSYSQFQFVVVFSQDYGAFCGPNVQDDLDQMLGKKDPVTTCNVSSGATSGGTGSGSPTTTTTPSTTAPGTVTTTLPPATTIPPAAGSAQELLNQAATDLDNAQKALAAGQLGEYQRLVDDARLKVKQAQQKTG
ncbi:MAG: hypothetical protein QOF40_1, partial [Actinomycetota bacterium]|nr:hypothetical protein [Actinomycetota bacterium]